MADLSRDDVLKLARLARIELGEEDATALSGELPRILDYVKQLQAVDVSGLEPTDEMSELTNVMRDDVVQDYGYTPDDLLQQVPAVEDRQIKVRRMLQG